MDSVKEYQKTLREAKRKCSVLLGPLSQADLMELGLKLDLSFSSLMNYKSMKGENLETALKIIDLLKPKQ